MFANRSCVVLVAIMSLMAVASSGCPSAVTTVTQAADDTDVAIVWTGMKHAWDREVHRAGKLGNWVEMASAPSFPKPISLHHLAEAGIVADNAARERPTSPTRATSPCESIR